MWQLRRPAPACPRILPSSASHLPQLPAHLVPCLLWPLPTLVRVQPSTPPTPAPAGPVGHAALTVGGLHGGHVGGSAALQEGVADEVGEEGQAGQQGAHGCGGRAGTRLSPSGHCPPSP